jgi:hypothetical protein
MGLSFYDGVMLNAEGFPTFWQTLQLPSSPLIILEGFFGSYYIPLATVSVLGVSIQSRLHLRHTAQCKSCIRVTKNALNVTDPEDVSCKVLLKHWKTLNIQCILILKAWATHEETVTQDHNSLSVI